MVIKPFLPPPLPHNQLTLSLGGSDPAFCILTLKPVASSLDLGLLQAVLEWNPGCGLKAAK